MQKNNSAADGLVSLMPGDVCFPYAAANTGGFADIKEAFIPGGMKPLLMAGKLLCEPSSRSGSGQFRGA